jgi:hypothetical protein
VVVQRPVRSGLGTNRWFEIFQRTFCMSVLPLLRQHFFRLDLARCTTTSSQILTNQIWLAVLSCHQYWECKIYFIAFEKNRIAIFIERICWLQNIIHATCAIHSSVLETLKETERVHIYVEWQSYQSQHNQQYIVLFSFIQPLFSLSYCHNYEWFLLLTTHVGFTGLSTIGGWIWRHPSG